MSNGVLAGKVVSLSSESMSVTVVADEASLPDLRELPFLGNVVVMCASDWQQTVDVMNTGTSRLIELEMDRAQLRTDIERIGRERDNMARAAQELQVRLSLLEDDRK